MCSHLRFSRESQMQDQVVAWNVAQYLDNTDLKKLYFCGAIPLLFYIARDENFWRCRVETLLERRIPDAVIGTAKNESWRLAYALLRRPGIAWRDKAWKKDNVLSVRILFSLGYEVKRGHTFLAAYYESIKILNFLVESDACSGLDSSDQPLVNTVKHKKIEAVRSLLSNPKIDIAKYGANALSATIQRAVDRSWRCTQAREHWILRQLV